MANYPRPHLYADVCRDPAEERRVNTLALAPEHRVYDWISIELDERASSRHLYCVTCEHEIPLHAEHVRVSTRLHGGWTRDIQCSRCYSLSATINRVAEYDHVLRGLGVDWARFLVALPQVIAGLTALHLSPYKRITVLDTHARRYHFQDLILRRN